jgi:predicted RNA-binding protein YlqC (UPF0109 family)
MKSQEFNQAEHVVRSMINSFIDHPESLTISGTEHTGFTWWSIQGHADDFSKLVGKGGAHFNALKMLLNAIGQNQSIQYALRRYEEPEPAQRKEYSPRKVSCFYSSEPAELLLQMVLASVGITEATLESQRAVSLDPTPDFSIRIYVHSPADFRLLNQPPNDSNVPMCLLGAIGTLFRAYANKEGVRFTLAAHIS